MEKSSFFNSVSGDRKYQAGDFADYFSSLIKNGVFLSSGTSLQVVAGSGMAIAVNAGRAWINGYLYVNDSPLNLTHDIADGVLNRIDRVVVRYDIADRCINTVIKKGVFASVPVAPALQRDADAYELGIAEVYIPAGATAIAQSNITDTRYDTEVCGAVTGTVDQIDTTGFTAQFADSFNTWFNAMKGQLTTDVAGNLQTEINNIISGITKTAKAAYADTSGNVAQQMDIIDGAFQVNSTGVTSATGSRNDYGIWDTWRMALADAKVTVSKAMRQDINGTSTYARMAWSSALNAVTNAYYLATFIENGPRILGSYPAVTLSFDAWCDSGISAATIRYGIEFNYGTGGSPSAGESLSSSTIAIDNKINKRYSITFYPSIVSKTFGTNNDSYMRAWVGIDGSMDPATAGTINLTKFQIDIGNTPLPYRPKTLAQELQETMRYYEQSYDYGTAPRTAYSQSNLEDIHIPAATNSGTGLGNLVKYKILKRLTPTVTLYSEAGTIGYGTIARTTPEVPLSTALGGRYGFLPIAQSSWGGAGTELTFHWTADSRY